MTSLTIAAAQPLCTPGALAANARAHADAIRDARARLVAFPELSLTGYVLAAPPVPLDDRALRPIVDACAAADAVALAGAVVEEDGRRSIATLRIDGDGAGVAYRKIHLHGAEHDHFAPGPCPEVIEVDGWRLGLAICRDTGIPAHAEALAARDVDAYVAGVINAPHELAEQDRRGRAIAAACAGYVVFAACAGHAGSDFGPAGGRSTVWAPDGAVLARAGVEAGEIARAELVPLVRAT